MRWSRSIARPLVALAAALAAVEAGAEPLFAGQRFPSGDYPDAMVLEDFDRDGVLDVVTANRISDDVTLLRGNGDGTFQAPIAFAAGAGPVSIDAADLNGDGFLDLVTANAGAFSAFVPPAEGSVTLLRGNGDGTFQAPVVLLEGDHSQVVIEDLDLDTVPDLVVGQAGVAVLLGNGDGSFQLPVPVEGGGGLLAFVVAKLDADAIPDLVGVDSLPGGSERSVRVFLGNGAGGFGAPESFPTLGPAASVAVDDLDGDDVPDLVVGEVAVNFFGGGGVSALLGNGDGSFQDPLDATGALFNVGELVLANLDADEVPDLVVSDYPFTTGFDPDSGGVRVFLGNGDGSFRSVAAFVAARHVTAIAVADVDGDATPDVISGDTQYFFDFPSGSYAGSSGVRVFAGEGDGSFGAGVVAADSGTVAALAAADLDGDGVPDLVTVNESNRSRSSEDTPIGVSVLLGRGDGGFEAPVSFSIGDQIGFGPSLVIADLDGDRDPDLIVGHGGRSLARDPVWVHVLLGNGDGSFGAPESFVTPGRGRTPGLAVADLDLDRVPDLIVNAWGVVAHRGNGDGTFQPAETVLENVFSPRSAIAVADLDGDRIPDLVVPERVTSSASAVNVLRGRGDGSFEEPFAYPTDAEAFSVAVADLDGDSLPDIAGATPDTEDLIVLWGEGGGRFGAPVSLPAGRAPVFVAVVDFDRDTVPDLVALEGAVVEGQELAVLLGKGAGAFEDPVFFVVGAGPLGLSIAPADLDGDGFPDIVGPGDGLAFALGLAPVDGLTVLLNRSAPRRRCDVDGNGAIDRLDVDAIFAARRALVVLGDPRDLTGNGLVTVNDARHCALQCDLPDCQVVGCGLLGIEPLLVLLASGRLRRRLRGRRPRRASVRIALGVLLAAAIQALPESAPAVQIAIVPQTLDVVRGNLFDVEVVVSELGDEVVSAYDLDLSYDASVLSATAVSFGSLLDPALEDASLLAGVVDFAQTSLASDADLLSAQPDAFTLATISFEAIAGGVSALDLPLDEMNGLEGLDAQTLDATALGAEVRVVPEPRSAFLVSAGTLLLGWARRGRTRHRPATP